MDAQDPRSDEELFRQYSDGGDCNALGSLFHRRADELLRIAAFLAPRPTEAEDLVQATFLSAIAHADQFRRDGRVMSWLCGILTNHARMLRRSERRRPPVAKDQVVEDPAEAALRSELQTALVGSIGRLPEPYRSVLKLHVENGLDSSEIGERLQRPPATVRKQIERALDRLRLALPFGLAAAITARVDAAALARHAADAAQFVERSPVTSAAPDSRRESPASLRRSASSPCSPRRSGRTRSSTWRRRSRRSRRSSLRRRRRRRGPAPPERQRRHARPRPGSRSSSPASTRPARR
jgi:RNA polymerase sigma-70 factor (ECF subfamily)